MDKKTVSSLENILKEKKNKTSKKRHCFVFRDDTWQSINETAKSYGVSASQYIEVLHDTHLLNNNKTEK